MTKQHRVLKVHTVLIATYKVIALCFGAFQKKSALKIVEILKLRNNEIICANASKNNNKILFVMFMFDILLLVLVAEIRMDGRN